MIAAAGALLVVLAARTPGVFQIDEYFQIVEPASHLLGRTSGAELTWEFQEAIRPFLQPALYAALARAAEALGIRDPFSLMWLMRLATGVASGLAALVAYRSIAPTLRDERLRLLLAAALTLPYFAPFLAVRTSSETLSGALLLAGLALRLGPGASLGRALASGLALGLAIQLRYQVGLAVVGVAVHDVVFAPRGQRLRATLPLALGVLATTALGLAVDAWAYGRFVPTPWNYLRVNVLDGRASTFGTLPFPAYPVLLLGAFPPWGALAGVGLGLLWLRRPRHLLTWATVPFVLGHSLIAHKEVRFLFPLLVPALLGLVLLWDDPDGGEGRGARVLAWLRRACLHPAVVGLNALGLALVCLMPSPDNLELQRFVREQARDGARFCALTDPALVHRHVAPFVHPPRGTRIEGVAGIAELEACAREAGSPALVLAKYPLTPEVEAWLEGHGERVFSALPPVLARVNLGGWVARADLTAAYRLAEGAANGGVR